MKHAFHVRRAAGISLVELLVSMTILAIATTIALTVYDSARRSYKVGENVAEQQQAVRIGFDLMNTDLRMAGFNTNPDGNKARPDEQIEAALATAVVLRADFDAMDPAEADTPEASLAGGAFLSVSTGNDEIVGYVLGKSGSSGTLEFEADVDPPKRDGSTEPVIVGGIDLQQNSPPYTLYRVTVAPDGTALPTPLIDNVSRLEFRYYDRQGNEIAPVGGGESPTDRDRRAAIRRIRIELEGLTRDPDPTWLDRNDSNPQTRAYRKFQLSGDVTPRNIGMSGLKDYQADTNAPTRPQNPPDLYPGHCDGLYVSWQANPPADEVAYYRVKYSDTGGNTDWYPSGATHCYLGGLLPGENYTVSVQAVDAAGNQSPMSDTALADVDHLLPANTPDTTLGLGASAGLNGQVALAWEAVGNNTGSVFGDPKSPLARDLAGYRVYRDVLTGFTPDASNRIADWNAALALPTPVFVDTQVVNCRPYYYRVAAVDRCLVEGIPGAEVPGSSWTNVQPRAPINVNAFFQGGTVRVFWDPPREDVLDESIHIDTHDVFRTAPIDDDIDPSTLTGADFTWFGTVVGGSEYIDSSFDLNLVLDPAAGKTVWYRVTASDDCSPVNVSNPSDMVQPLCYFSGTPRIQDPGYGNHVWGSTQIEVEVVGGSGSYNELRLRFEHLLDGDDIVFSLPMTGTYETFDWTALPGTVPTEFFKLGKWRIDAAVDQLIGGGPAVCTATTSTVVDVRN